MILATQKLTPDSHSMLPARTVTEIRGQSENVRETRPFAILVDFSRLSNKKLLHGTLVGVQGLGIVDIRGVLLDSREPKKNAVFLDDE